MSKKESEKLKEIREAREAAQELYREQMRTGDVPMIPASEDPNTMIRESDKDTYHIEIVDRINNPAMKRYDVHRTVRKIPKHFLGELGPDGLFDSKRIMAKFVNSAEEKRIIHNPFKKQDAASESQAKGKGKGKNNGGDAEA